MSMVKGYEQDEDEDDRLKTDDKEFFTLRDESTAFDVAVALPLILPLHTSILFFSIPKIWLIISSYWYGYLPLSLPRILI
jgi:hypothetical protein